MDKNESKKAALIRMLQIYLKHGSPNDPLVQEDFVYYLKEDYGIEVERKTVGRNITLLKEMGFDIRNATQGTYLGGGNPETSVLNLLTGKKWSSFKTKAQKTNTVYEIHPITYKKDTSLSTLIADKKLLGQMKKWFGSKAEFANYPEDGTKIRVICSSSANSVINFAIRFYPRVELISPPASRKAIKDYLAKFVKTYNDEN